MSNHASSKTTVISAHIANPAADAIVLSQITGLTVDQVRSVINRNGLTLPARLRSTVAKARIVRRIPYAGKP